MTNPEPTDGSAIRSFKIDVPESVLSSIMQRVRAFRWDAWTEPPDAGDWRYGPPASFMRALCDYWIGSYDWRFQESLMNAQPHFVTALDDLDIHFVHERGSGSNPPPLLIAHGWPYFWHSYQELIGPLAHPEQHGGRIEDAFDVIIPSYPGYDFASRPCKPMGPYAIARVLGSKHT